MTAGHTQETLDPVPGAFTAMTRTCWQRDMPCSMTETSKTRIGETLIKSLRCGSLRLQGGRYGCEAARSALA